MSDKLKFILKLIIFIGCLVLVVYGHQTTGKIYLLIQLVGLAGLISLLWNYNRKYV